MKTEAHRGKMTSPRVTRQEAALNQKLHFGCPDHVCQLSVIYHRMPVRSMPTIHVPSVTLENSVPLK